MGIRILKAMRYMLTVQQLLVVRAQQTDYFARERDGGANCSGNTVVRRYCRSGDLGISLPT